mgnify:CR=1 FL=1
MNAETLSLPMIPGILNAIRAAALDYFAEERSAISIYYIIDKIGMVVVDRNGDIREAKQPR